LPTHLPKLVTILKQQNLATTAFLKPFNSFKCDKLFDYLQHTQLFSEETLHLALQSQLNLTLINQNTIQIDTSLEKKYNPIPTTYHPLFETTDTVYIGITNPYLTINLTTNKTIAIKLTPSYVLNQLKSQSASTTIQTIFSQAITQNSSDIHFFETATKSCHIYFRINGQLTFNQTCTHDIYNQIKQYIKLEANLELGISLTPQDGQLIFNHHKIPTDIRVSCLPTLHGEDIVCRLFTATTCHKSFSDLGIKNSHETLIKTILNNKSGLILVTGPTGSGKTTTLYTILRYLQSQNRGNIITLEDPVEKQLAGIRQSTIKPTKNYTYATGLKSILRQDPDIIMVGEIRDKQTAELAIEAAYTGHLVLSTLHTHDVMSTIYRFKHFNCDPFLLNYVLKGIITQQLTAIKTNNIVTHRQLDQTILHFQQPLSTNIFEQHSPAKLGVFLN